MKVLTRGAMTVALAALAGGPATAQYREGMPEVLSAPVMRGPSAAAMTPAEFRTVYLRHKSPRMVVFWNRALSDQVASTYEDRRTESGLERETQTIAGTEDGEVTDTTRSSSKTSVSGSYLVNNGARTGLAETTDWKVEQLFQRVLLQSGVRLVDRSLIIRTNALKLGPAAAGNAMAVETSALVDKAELLVEVLQSPDSNAFAGYTFRVSVKDIRSGLLIANIVSDGGGTPMGPSRIVAGGNGYERERPKAPPIETAGSRLALETMQALVANWR